MIILDKKRLALISSMLLVAVFAFTFQRASLNNTVQTVTLPVSNKVIVLDARTSENQMKVRKVVVEQQKQKLI